MPFKTMRIYPNNKPYINKDIKDRITRKRMAFKNKDLLQQRLVQKELNQKLASAKRQNKDSVEN